MRFSRKGMLQWLAVFLPAVALTLFFIGWSGFRSNARATREKFEKLHAGTTLEEVQEIMTDGCEIWGGFRSDVEFQAICRDYKDYEGRFHARRPPFPNSKIYICFEDDLLKYKAIWEPNLLDVVERWVYLTRHRFGL